MEELFLKESINLPFSIVKKNEVIWNSCLNTLTLEVDNESLDMPKNEIDNVSMMGVVGLKLLLYDKNVGIALALDTNALMPCV